eukprot:CAMPEP_0172318844 /NCGR_PEP_ID=MMETSP1058-20130122/36007_1 /TAXON_ID=83371 /ORGANISM="Detonula confervacea, Strain CCMP 353" /LENGTH=272 /DNA_ID=CAMNT_0013033759 /DNA_START=722 /DNA_END=1540 /DNA_ORIENTATION=-
MNFGPRTKMHWLMKKEFYSMKANQDETISRVWSNKNETFFITPIITSHVGLDTSLYGWLLPPNPMVFSVFRNPFERLLSSFHYGIRLGANRPGQVRMCNTRGIQHTAKWQERVADARKLATTSNNSTVYQAMLREYLDKCSDAVYNAYTAFLDPLTKNLTVAMNHLEKHVVVGLQHDINGTLQRWRNITLDACNEHPDYSKMKKVLTNTSESHGEKKFRASPIVKDSVVLSSPDISQFDQDLQDIIRACTEEDEVIYKRATEIYEEQSRWGL